MSYKEQIDQLKTEGAIVLKGCLSFDEAIYYRERIENYFRDKEESKDSVTHSGASIQPNALAYDYFCDFSDIFKKEEFIGILKEITSDNLKYLHHSDVHYGQTIASGWHTDVQLYAYENSPYPKDYIHPDSEVYRVAIYFQDHLGDDGGLSIKVGSHINPEVTLTKKLKTGIGDVIIFDARVSHKGHFYERGDRCSFFTAFGPDNEWSELHQRGAIARQLSQINKTEYVPNENLIKRLDSMGIKY